MFGAPKKCAKCDKQVYSIEELKCLDKVNRGLFFLSYCRDFYLESSVALKVDS